MIRRALPLAAILALVAPAAAGANPSLDEAQAIAYAAFPGQCGPVLTIHWDSPVLAENDWQGAAVVGDPSCEIHLASAITDTPRGCDVLVHERGHLAGLEHAETGVMNPTVWAWPPCHPEDATTQAELTVVSPEVATTSVVSPRKRCGATPRARAACRRTMIRLRARSQHWW